MPVQSHVDSIIDIPCENRKFVQLKPVRLFLVNNFDYGKYGKHLLSSGLFNDKSSKISHQNSNTCTYDVVSKSAWNCSNKKKKHARKLKKQISAVIYAYNLKNENKTEQNKADETVQRHR